MAENTAVPPTKLGWGNFRLREQSGRDAGRALMSPSDPERTSAFPGAGWAQSWSPILRRLKAIAESSSNSGVSQPVMRLVCCKVNRGKTMNAKAIIIWLIVGAVAGWLAGMVVKGGGYGLIGNIIVGIVGGLIAGWLLPHIGVVIAGGVIGAIINAFIGAVILLVILRLIKL